jgi:hypothetical protein
MAIKTSRSLISSLRASAFRRVTCDQRTWAVREIRTLRGLLLRGRYPVASLAAISRVRTGRP